MAKGGHAWYAPLLYEIRPVNARAVRILLECILVYNYCSSTSETGSTFRGVTSTKEKYIEDICCVEDSDEPLIITTPSLERRLCAYNASVNKREWIIKGTNAQGVTTDGRGLVFVCDADRGCVQVYSTDGRCLGVLISEGDGGLGKPMKIRWCESTASVVIAHLRSSIWHISSVRVDLFT